MSDSGKCSFTVDTGSEVSLIKFTAIKKSTICSKKKIVIIGINDDFKMKTLGQTNLKFQNKTDNFDFNFHIIGENICIETDGLIGLDFLLNYTADISLKKMLMTLLKTELAQNTTIEKIEQKKIDISKIHEKIVNENHKISTNK